MELLDVDVAGPGDQVCLMVLDVRDAFYTVPQKHQERKHHVVKLNSASGPKYFCYLVPPQGSKNAPQIWGRVASWIARLLQSAFKPN
eukprot:4670462-Amphidinium_carterae.1